MKTIAAIEKEILSEFRKGWSHDEQLEEFIASSLSKVAEAAIDEIRAKAHTMADYTENSDLDPSPTLYINAKEFVIYLDELKKGTLRRN
jgi:hypothetical protein